MGPWGVMDKGCHHGTRAKGALPPLPTALLSANLLLLALSPNLHTSLSNPNLPERPLDCFRPPTQWASVVVLAFSHAWNDFHFVFRAERSISKTSWVTFDCWKGLSLLLVRLAAGFLRPMQLLVLGWSREECCDRPLFPPFWEQPVIPESWKGVFIHNRRWGLSSFMYLPIPSGSLWMLNGGTVMRKGEEAHATDCTSSHTCQRQWCAIRLQEFCLKEKNNKTK